MLASQPQPLNLVKSAHLSVQILEEDGLLGFDERPCIAFASCSGSTADAVNVFPQVHRDVVIDDVRYVRNVDTSRDQVRADESARNTTSACVRNRSE